MSAEIFILEDNEDIRYILDIFLNEEGYNVTVFPTVNDFLCAYYSKLPDLFLLDVMLPDGDGLSICNQIKNDVRASHIPVLIMSAHLSEDRLIMESCADGFIEKPFDLISISQYISKLLN